MSYGIIFWGSSTQTHDIFKIQKRAVRIVDNKSGNHSCRDIFKRYHILTLPAQYIISLAMFVIKHKDLSQTNADIHNLNTRQKRNLHVPLTNLSRVQKGSALLGNENI
jgi:hypothetical protein